MEGVKKTSLHPEISGDFYFKMKGNGIFEIEIEEEITEETEVPLLLEIYWEFEGENLMGDTSKNACIADRYDSYSVAFYMVHSDGTLTLLWTKEGGMQ
ncbi:hypothetical protein K2V61_01595 [Staphylococcus simulans]|uniref:hypothetical protein n=1 Tax=Staphylococcus simulans TaxID=1286 RepID=UPI001E6225FE|nr:hypothetical protein [Staphylococcus simulans]MCD8914253.1 hypothetical protein [Staphylococcus simulans]